MKHKYRSLLTCVIILFIALYTIPSVLGKTRQSYLTSFIYNNEIEGQGFSNSIEDSPTISFEATAYAIDILTHYLKKPHDIETLTSNLEGSIEQTFGNDEVILYDLYFLMNALINLDPDYELKSQLEYRIYEYLNDSAQAQGGFSYSNSSKSVNLASTYYALRLYKLIYKPIVNRTVHKNWVLSCNNDDGGFGGNQSLSSTILNTYFAVSILELLYAIGDLTNASNTISYLQSFYVSNSIDSVNFGGYLPNEVAEYTSLSSTYYCVKAISLIDDTKLDKQNIKKWVLAHQNFIDGGFAENSEGYQQKTSSVTSSNYAFNTLKILDPSLSSLTGDIWMVEFNYLVLVIVLGVIGVSIVGVILFLRRRKI